MSANQSIHEIIQDILHRDMLPEEKTIVQNLINANRTRFRAIGHPRVARFLANKLADEQMRKKQADAARKYNLQAVGMLDAANSVAIDGNDAITSTLSASTLSLPSLQSTVRPPINDDDMHEYHKKVLKERDNPEYYRDTLPAPTDDNTALAVNKMSAALDNIFLRPVYVTNYLSLDTKYANWGTNNAPMSVLNFQLTANDNASNNTVVKLKYPLSDIIQSAILPFTIPPYAVPVTGGTWNGFEMVRCPSNKRMQVIITEVVETFKTTPAEQYTILADAQWDTETYDGTNLPYTTKITPVNAGVITYRFTLKYMNNITISLNDFTGPVYLPSPFIIGTVVTFGNPTVFTASTAGNAIGTFLTSGERVYLSGVTTSAPGSAPIAQLNSVAGLIATAIGQYQFSVPVDSSPVVNPQIGQWTAVVNSRRSIIPFVFSQLRPDVFN
jgi:hypothetical protein